MRWLDRRGHPLPLDPIFAEFLLQSQRRAGLAMGRILHARQLRWRNDEIPIVLTRDGLGTTTERPE